MAMLNNQMVNLGNIGELRKLGLLSAVYRAKQNMFFNPVNVQYPIGEYFE